MDTFDGLFSQSYELDKLPVDEEEELFKNLANLINDMTTDVTNDKFSHSIYDTEFPIKVAERLSTRDILKQKIEDSYAAADKVGPSGTGELEHLLDSFQQWCASKDDGSIDISNAKFVPMTNSA